MLDSGRRSIGRGDIQYLAFLEARRPRDPRRTESVRGVTVEEVSPRAPVAPEKGETMRRRLWILFGVVVLLAVVVGAPAGAKAPLRATTEHDFMAGYGIVRGLPDDAQLLGWQGTITGDIEGCIEWWFDLDPGIVPTGQASHYFTTTEIREGPCPEGEPGRATGELLLAADGHGTTTARHMKNSNWRANATVTVAEGEYEAWLGRNVHESGHFEWDDGVPLRGTSEFRAN